MKRAGFTMIELIFVIVILGILAAVALPKFVGVAEQANDSKIKAFAGTLNRTVGPALWSKSISDGNSGAISSYCATIGAYTDIPTDVLTDLGNCNFSHVAASGATLDINFTDGNGTNAPTWNAHQ